MANPVLFVLIDGLRPEALAYGDVLTGLLRTGAYTLRAQSVMPSMTLPCHMSIFHSVPPTRHGITQNIWQPMARPMPGLVDQAHAQGRRSAFVYNWEPLRDLSRPEALHCAYFVNNNREQNGDLEIARLAVQVINAHQPEFTFVYLGTVDEVGHIAGWMSAPYIEQVKRADEALGILLEAIPGETAVVVQSDHGGHDRGHGTDHPEDMTIPWMVHGRGIKANHELETPVSLLDTAPTIARLLGIEPHERWEGHCVEEAFI